MKDCEDRYRYYGRRRTRSLRPRQRRLLVESLPAVRVDLVSAAPLDPATLFPHPVTDVWLEIGFGAGEHLAWQAQVHPDIGMIGAEPYMNGVARLLASIEQRQLRNLRILADDARPLLAKLADRSLGRAFLLFPDPWPKTRHHRRRIFGWPFLDSLGRILRPGAELRVATDDSAYLRWIMHRALAHPDFEWMADGRADWEHRPPDWPETRYERKCHTAGRRPVFVRLVRSPD